MPPQYEMLDILGIEVYRDAPSPAGIGYQLDDGFIERLGLLKAWEELDRAGCLVLTVGGNGIYPHDAERLLRTAYWRTHRKTPTLDDWRRLATTLKR